MATTPLPPDFTEFLKSLSSHGVEYLLIGGYAVGLHGYPRATADLDVWVSIHPQNARAITDAIREFGFETATLAPALFLQEDIVVRMGVPPLRIDILTTIAGVEFRECYPHRKTLVVDDAEFPFIALGDLKKNKQTTGRTQDISDLETPPLIERMFGPHVNSLEPTRLAAQNGR